MIFKKGRESFLPFLCFAPFYRTSAPKGSNASSANLKCCNPKGMPMMVIQHTIPDMAEAAASSQPQKSSQKIFNIIEPPEKLPYTISFPKGQSIRDANLKHCNPTGMPMMVMQHNMPAKNHPMAQISPPNISHNILPNKLIVFFTPFLFIICHNITILLLSKCLFAFF